MDLVIDHLHLRVGGITAEEGEQLAMRVGERLSQHLQALARSETNRTIGAITARIEAQSGETVDHLADRIVDAILRQM
jgi:hypothetical protein